MLAAVQSRLRIIGGEHRSRLLETPPGHEVTRPMTSRVKESLFDILRGWFEDATVLDLFAGVGTLGLEAISQGAKRVVLVERDRDVLQCLERNIASLRCQDRCTALQADALSATTLARVPTPIDVAFMDPPYDIALQTSGRRRILEQAAHLRPLFGPRGWFVLRLPFALEESERHVPGFAGPEIRQYGDQFLHLFTPEKIA